jgi:hypothetical protein
MFLPIKILGALLAVQAWEYPTILPNCCDVAHIDYTIPCQLELAGNRLREGCIPGGCAVRASTRKEAAPEGACYELITLPKGFFLDFRTLPESTTYTTTFLNL